MAGNTPSAKARALGAEIKRVRVEADIGLRDLARRVGLNPGVLSHWENGTRSPKAVEVDRILTELGVNGVRREDILELTRDTDAPRWVVWGLPEQRQHLNALHGFERDARRIVKVAPLLVPGLLQTESYARAIMTAAGVDRDEIEPRLLIRMGHQRILARVRLTALIGEAALRQEVGGQAVLGEQLRHLLVMADHENVIIRVVPFSAGWNPALDGACTVIESADAEETLVDLENRLSGQIMHRKEDVSAYEAAVTLVMEVAMSSGQSKELIATVIEQLAEKR
jgi:transcriptional regulator with XRE-family HTH domain